jgi:hypothetical protein
MVGDIISEQWAELSRNGGRLHSEIVGDIDQNPQAVRGDVDCRPRWPLATLAAPIYLATLPAQGGERAIERWSTTCSSLTIPNLIRVLSRFRR